MNPKHLAARLVIALCCVTPFIFAPVLLAQPTYNWGYVSVQKIVDKVHLKQDVPQIIPMELVRVTKDNLGTWARQLKDWGFTDVPDAYLKQP